MKSDEKRQLAAKLFRESLQDINPQTVVSKNIRIENNTLAIAGKEYDLSTVENIYLIGIGKAAEAMAHGAEMKISHLVSRGVLLSHTFCGDLPEKYDCYVCTHPLPTPQNIEGADSAIALAEAAGENDLVLCLVSGGGSSLFSRPVEGLSIKDLATAADVLMKNGAPIDELNAVRKHLSMVKGGKFLRLIQPAQSVTLCLSDVPGDDITVIASGPTTHDNSTYEDIMNIFRKHNIIEKLPENIVSFVRQGQQGKQIETLKAGDPIFRNSRTTVIGRNSDMLQAMAGRAEEIGFQAKIEKEHFQGEARDFGKFIAKKAIELAREASEKKENLAWFQGGETTVRVSGEGLGGRNTEVALAAAIALDGVGGCLVMAAGTDGKDGPTDAAGAVADGTTVQRAAGHGLDAGWFLDRNDSFHLFDPLGDTIITGPTGTNLMDVVMILAWK